MTTEDQKRLAEEMAQAPTSQLISIIVIAEIKQRPGRERDAAARKELDARIPSRSWWTYAE